MARGLGRTIWAFLIVAVAAALIFIAASRPGRDRPITVSITHAVRQDLSSWTTGNGKIEPLDPRIIQSRLATRIERVEVTEGQTVKAGETMLTLDSTDSRSELAHTKEQLLAAQEDRKTALQGGSADELAQLRSDLSKANAEVERLTHDRDILERLFKTQAATKLEVEQNRIALEKAQADQHLLEEKKHSLTERSKIQAERAGFRADEAREAIQSLEGRVDSARVSAPVGGTVYSLPAKSGTFVRTGDVLAEMADLKHVRVRAFIDEPELGSLKERQPVEISWDALPSRVWMGEVEQLPKTIVTRGTRNVGEVLCSVSNDDAALLPNTNVSVRIRTAGRQNALTVPRGAVRSDGNKRYVFAVDGGKLRKQEVMLGISSPTTYEVLGGIAETDSIVLQTDGELREGQIVEVRELK
jgi:HlyD family secretion protein